ncbi:MAG TPA: hypothetical protein VIJ09_12590 [Acidimicrobiales bacterium]
MPDLSHRRKRRLQNRRLKRISLHAKGYFLKTADIQVISSVQVPDDPTFRWHHTWVRGVAVVSHPSPIVIVPGVLVNR